MISIVKFCVNANPLNCGKYEVISDPSISQIIQKLNDHGWEVKSMSYDVKNSDKKVSGYIYCLLENRHAVTDDTDTILTDCISGSDDKTDCFDWEKVKAYLINTGAVSDVGYNVWINPLIPSSYDQENGEIIFKVCVPSNEKELISAYYRKNIKSLIEAAYSSVTGKKCSVGFEFLT